MCDLIADSILDACLKDFRTAMMESYGFRIKENGRVEDILPRLEL